MKRNPLISKNEKCFNFSKMDKKNVQFSKTQIFYEKCLNCDHNEKLSSGHIKNNFHFVMIKFLYKNLKTFFFGYIKDTMDTSNEQKTSNNFSCEKCDYITSSKYNYERHISSDKHKRIHFGLSGGEFFEQNEQNNYKKNFKCICGNIYKFSQGLSKHKKNCSYINNINDHYKNEGDLKVLTNLVLEVVKKNQELVSLNNETQKQNQELTNKIVEMSKVTNNTLINNHSNNNNKTFNLNMFLNETCKDAMNITDFVDSLQLQLSDLEDVGKLGFVEGISNIIVKNLKALDVHKRPVHCADKKREVIYIKDEDKWEKDNDEKQRLRKAIKNVAYKNEKLLPKYKELHPGCNYSDSKYSDHYSKLVIEAMGGSGNNDVEKQDKIIRNIAKEVVIDKT